MAWGRAPFAGALFPKDICVAFTLAQEVERDAQKSAARRKGKRLAEVSDPIQSVLRVVDKVGFRPWHC